MDFTASYNTDIGIKKNTNQDSLAVRIIAAPTHIAGMPVAVNINCHVSRHAEVTL